MKNMIHKFGLIAAFGLGLAGAVAAQDNKAPEPQPDTPQANANRPPENQGDLFRQLGLSVEQLQQIRHIKQEQRPLMDEAQKHFREANHALDEAIYADQVNDADFQARLRDVQAAQGEVQRLRFMNELAVRRILTPEQLVRFRELRERFEQARRNMQGRPFRDEGVRPMRGRMLRNDKPADQATAPGKQVPQKAVQ